MRKADELEGFFRQFPDIPKEVIIKEDLLRLGVNFSHTAVEAGKESPLTRGHLFTQVQAKAEEFGEEKPSQVPEDLMFKGGPYDLRKTTVYNRLNPNSPYLVDVVDGQIAICADGVPIAEAKYASKPKYFSKKFDDGTPYSAVLPVRGFGKMAFLVAHRVCHFWGAKQECKFCDINENVRQKAKLGLEQAKAKAHWPVEYVAEVAEQVFLREDWAEQERPLGIFITGGTILGKLAGKEEDDFYLQYVEAIRERIGHRWPILIQSGAKDKETCKRYRAAGVDIHGANIEVWDKKLFEIICPGKSQHIGREEWIKRVVESVDVFGECNVAPNFVLGVEMCQPYGFKDMRDALKSTKEGLEFLMSHGVTPRWESWNISPYSVLAGNVPPPLEFYIRADLAWLETWVKYDLPPIGLMGVKGPGRARVSISCIHDMDPSAGKWVR